MDDNLSIKSSDSVTTSGEYEIVPEELETQATIFSTSPTLNIANGNFNDLEKNLTEVIHELDDNDSRATPNLTDTNTGQSTHKPTQEASSSDTTTNTITTITTTIPITVTKTSASIISNATHTKSGNLR